MGRVTTAVVGAGRWGRNIVRALKSLEDEGLVKLVAVVDVDEDRARKVAEEFNIPEYLTGIEDIPSRGIEAVAIAVPADKLASVGKYLITHGINTFIEKPVSLEPSDIEELIRLSRAYNVITQPGFIVRFDPVVKELKELIRSYGIPKYLIFKRLSRRPPWMRKYPIVFDLTIHDIDLTFYLIGRRNWKIRSVYVLETDEGASQIVYANVTFGKTLVTYITDGELPIKIREVTASFNNAYIRADLVSRKVIIKGIDAEVVRDVEGEEPLITELRAFIMRVRGKEISDVPTLNDALEAARLAKEIVIREPESVILF